jgi:hypothetical protein
MSRWIAGPPRALDLYLRALTFLALGRLLRSGPPPDRPHRRRQSGACSTSLPTTDPEALRRHTLAIGDDDRRPCRPDRRATRADPGLRPPSARPTPPSRATSPLSSSRPSRASPPRRPSAASAAPSPSVSEGAPVRRRPAHRPPTIEWRGTVPASARGPRGLSAATCAEASRAPSPASRSASGASLRPRTHLPRTATAISRPRHGNPLQPHLRDGTRRPTSPLSQELGEWPWTSTLTTWPKPRASSAGNCFQSRKVALGLWAAGLPPAAYGHPGCSHRDRPPPPRPDRSRARGTVYGRANPTSALTSAARTSAPPTCRTWSSVTRTSIGRGWRSVSSGGAAGGCAATGCAAGGRGSPGGAAEEGQPREGPAGASISPEGAAREGFALGGAAGGGGPLGGKAGGGRALGGAIGGGGPPRGRSRSANLAGALVRSPAGYADLRGAEGLTQAQLENVIGDAATLLPDSPADDTGEPYRVYTCWTDPPGNLDDLIDHVAPWDEAGEALRAEWLCGPDNPRRPTGTPLALDAPYPDGHPLAHRTDRPAALTSQS